MQPSMNTYDSATWKDTQVSLQAIDLQFSVAATDYQRMTASGTGTEGGWGNGVRVPRIENVFLLILAILPASEEYHLEVDQLQHAWIFFNPKRLAEEEILKASWTNFLTCK